MSNENYIDCPKYGGKRYAPACCTQDRYRFCRKKCKALTEHLKQNPDLPAQALDMYKEKTSQFSKMNFANKGLPNPALTCRLCGFVARSNRGLKAHATRSHEGLS